MPVNPLLIWLALALAGALIYCTSTRLQPGKARAGCRLLAFTVASVGVNQISYASHFAPVGEAPGVFWLNSGLLVATLIAAERRWYPAYVFATVLVQLHSGLVIHDLSWTTSGFWTTANVSEGVVGSLLLRRAVAGQPDITRPRTFVLFLVLCAGVATAVSAAIGTTALALVRGQPDWFAYWQVWWVSNAMGVLSLGPALLAWTCDGRPERVPRRWPHLAEAVALPLLLVAATLVAVGPFNLQTQSVLDFPYLVVPLLVWAAMRFEARFATAAALLVALVTVYTANGTLAQVPGIGDTTRGPFRNRAATIDEAVLAIQAFLFVTLLATQLLIAMSYRRQREEQQRANLRDQLYAAQRMEAVAQLAGGVAHDLNNLLAVISAYRDQVEERVGDDENLRPALQAMDHAAENATALARSLLDLSRHDPIERRPLDAYKLLCQAMTVCQPLLPRNIQLRLAPPPGSDTTVFANANQVQQAVLNLVLNARDAMAGQGGELAVWAREHDAGRGMVEIGVRDTGCGIAPEDLDRVFEPLFTTKPHGQGTGLGLSIVQHIAETHDGRVAIDSQLGKGTTVRLLLPHKPAPIDTPDDAAHAPQQETVGGTSPGDPDQPPAAKPVAIVFIADPQVRGAVVHELIDQGWSAKGVGSIEQFTAEANQLNAQGQPACGVIDLRGCPSPQAVTGRELPIPSVVLAGDAPLPQLADPASRVLGMPLRIKNLVKSIDDLR